MDIFDQIQPEQDIFDKIAPKEDIFDKIQTESKTVQTQPIQEAQPQEQTWGQYLKGEFSPQGLLTGAKRAASILTIPRDIGHQLADPIAENILAYSRGDKGYGQAWKDMAVQEGQKALELTRGASRAMGEPLGIYGKEALKQAWIERPVESVFGISPIVGPPIAKGIQYGLNKIPQKPIQSTSQAKDAFRTAIKEIRPTESISPQEAQAKTTVLSQLKSAYQKNYISTINSILEDWKQGQVIEGTKPILRNTGIAIPSDVSKQPSVKQETHVMPSGEVMPGKTHQQIGGGNPPNTGLVVANIGNDGKIYYGEPSDIHFNLSERYPYKMRGEWKSVGFADSTGKFLTRKEALKEAEKTQEIKVSSNMVNELDALDYRESQPISLPKGFELEKPQQQIEPSTGGVVPAVSKEPWQMTSDEAYEMVKQKAFVPANKNYKIGDIGTFYRSGEIPKSGKSYNFRDKYYEKGISVYQQPLATSFAGLQNREWYMGKGKIIDFGSDGEPVIKPTGKWEKLSIKKQPNAFMSWHYKQVQQALSEGKPVPLEVLKDYPELQGTSPKTKGLPIGVTAPTVIDEKIEPKAGSLQYGAELPKYSSSINLTNLDEPYDIKKLVSDLVERSGIQKKTVTWEQAKQDAEELGLSEKQLLKRTRGKAENYAYIDAARQVGVDTAVKTRQVMDEAMKLATDMTKTQSERDQALLLANMQMNKAASVLAQVSDMAAESGRALQMFRRKVAGYNATKNYEAMLDALGGREMTLEMLKKFTDIDPSDTKATIQFIRDVSKAKTTDMIYEAWRNAILSGTKTHLSNALSNTITILSKPVETIIAAGLEHGRALFTGKEPQVKFREVKPEVFGLVQGIKEGVRTGLKSFVDELPSGESKLEFAGDVAIPGKLGKVIRTPQRLLMASDEFSKSIVYRSEMNRYAYRTARLEGKKGQELNNRIAELIANPIDEMKQRAHDVAVYRTYNKPLGAFGNAVMRLRKIDPSGTLKYIIPFVRTPVNVVKFGLERTPLNFARLGYKASKGQMGSEWSSEFAKPILGSTIAAYLYLLAKEGYITGAGPKDKAERDTLYRTGWQPYSFYVPGWGYFSYARIEPLGSIVGTVADYKEITDTGKASEEKAYQALYSISKNWTNKTFLIGLINLGDALSDPERYGERFINGLSTSLVPNIVQPFDRDEYLRESKNPLEAMERKIPIMNQALPLRYDVWGRPIEKTTSTISPIQRSKEKFDDVDKEALRLQQVADYTISMPSRMIEKNKEMTQEQYERYVKNAGQISYRQIDKLIHNRFYQQLPDDRKAELWRRTIEKSRSVIKKQITSSYKYN